MNATAHVRILGVDPGSRTTGWGVVAIVGSGARLVAAGAISTRGPTIAERLLEVRNGLDAVISEHRPAVVAVERPFLGKNPATALVIGMARGAALVAAAQAGLEVAEYPPATVKKAVVGNGRASKEQVGAMVRVLLGLASVPKPDDVADALAVALAYVHRRG